MHREILYRSNSKGGFEIPSTHRDPPLAAFDPSLGAFDPPLSTFSSLSPALILLEAKQWINDLV